MKKLVSIVLLALTISSCQNNEKKEMEIVRAKQMVIDSIAKVETLKKQTIDSMNSVAKKERLQKQERQAVATNNSITETTTTTGTKRKKGWSNKAKGAVIGAGVGAVTGAMVDKKKGEGAVVGGVLGAGAGYGVGAILDNKEKKKNKQ